MDALFMEAPDPGHAGATAPIPCPLDRSCPCGGILKSAAIGGPEQEKTEVGRRGKFPTVRKGGTETPDIF